MGKTDSILDYIKHPIWALARLSASGYIPFPDRNYIEITYYRNMGKKCDLDHPKTYTEKLQWIKLYDRRKIYTTLVDKYLVKDYIAKKVGSSYLIPTLGVWDQFEDIEFNSLPNQFVLKTTHDSGGVVICKDKKTFNQNKVRSIIKKSLKRNYYLLGREWPYKNVIRRIIAEQYMEDRKTGELRDYKFFCFNGKAKALFVATDRQNRPEPCFDFFDMDYNHLNIKNGHPLAVQIPQKPTCFDEMVSVAESLSEGFPEIRVDFYEVDGRPYVGELTLFHHSGWMPFIPEKWDSVFGGWIDLPRGGIT